MLGIENDIYVDEILKRFRLIFSSFSSTLNRYGIVDSRTPSTSVPGDLRPFSVSINTADPSTIDIYGGTAVFKSGEIIVIDNTLLGVPLADGSLNAKNIVYLRFSEEEVDPVLTRFDTLVNSRVDFLSDPLDYVRVTSISDYLALSVIERDLTIPIAVITPYAVAAPGGGSTTGLAIDMSRRTITYNRPWFSPVDIEHRSYVGSGIVGPRNPHGLSFNDISAAADFTLFNLMLDHGMVVAKEKNYAGVPGKLCEEVVPNASLELDTLGTVTGYINARFLRLSRFPYLVIRATDSATQVLDFAPIHIPGQNIIFFLGADELVGQDILIKYISVSAGEPPVDASPTIFTVRQPESREVAIASGNVISAFQSDSLSFEDAGPIPSEFLIYCDGNGDIRRYPATIFCVRSLNDLGSSLQELDSSLPGPSRLKFGLTGAIPGPTLDISIEVTGTEAATGAVVTETIFFGPTWTDSLIPTCSENDSQFRTTTNRYVDTVNFSVVTRSNDGPLSRLIVYADADPIQTDDLSDILPISEVTWSGLSLCVVRDVRPINTNLKMPTLEPIEPGSRAIAESTFSLSTASPKYLFQFWGEDFDRPRYIGSEVTDTDLATNGLGPTQTVIKKTSIGLSDGDIYVSKPIGIRPHISTPLSLRFVPIEPGPSFELRARVFDETSGAWSNWYTFSTFTTPDYTISLAGMGPLVKWQMYVSGKVRGMTVVYLTDSEGVPPAFVFDVGAFDEGSFG